MPNSCFMIDSIDDDKLRQVLEFIHNTRAAFQIRHYPAVTCQPHDNFPPEQPWRSELLQPGLLPGMPWSMPKLEPTATTSEIVKKGQANVLIVKWDERMKLIHIDALFELLYQPT